MKLSLQDLTTLFPDPLWLRCENAQTYADLATPQRYSSETARHNALLNARCLSAFAAWVQENLELLSFPALWPSEAELPGIWEFVNGTALVLDHARLVLIPSEAMDTEEFTVPQEWVDIPTWSADYYLPMQVNLEDNWICAWGYIAHSQIQARGRYDSIYRTYSIDRDWVMTDLAMVWEAQNIAIKAQSNLESSDFSRSQIELWIQSLSQPSPYSPRLDLDFEQWAILLERGDLRQKLYRLRLENAASSVQSPMINTGLWLKDKIDEFAQELSWVLLPTFTPDLGLMRTLSAERSPMQELASIVTRLKQTGVAVDETARGAYQDLQLEDALIRCYAMVWDLPNPDRTPQWQLLVVLAPQTGTMLPPGIKMIVRDEAQILVERSLDGQGQNQSLFASVSGGWEETFEVAIALINGTSITLPAFGFYPESP
jgi:Protein of unknown function (DUF1822)